MQSLAFLESALTCTSAAAEIPLNCDAQHRQGSCRPGMMWCAGTVAVWPRARDPHTTRPRYPSRSDDDVQDPNVQDANANCRYLPNYDGFCRRNRSSCSASCGAMPADRGGLPGGRLRPRRSANRRWHPGRLRQADHAGDRAAAPRHQAVAADRARTCRRLQGEESRFRTT